MKPLLRLAYPDESKCWDRKIRRAAGRIAGVYVYDKHWSVFCFEMMASYELYLIGYLTELPVNDRVQMAMEDSTMPGCITYVHTLEINMLPCRRHTEYRTFNPFRIAGLACTTNLPGPFPHDHDQAIAEALEYLHANGITTT